MSEEVADTNGEESMRDGLQDDGDIAMTMTGYLCIMFENAMF